VGGPLLAETLERRKLLAVTATLSGTTLQIDLGAAGDTAGIVSNGTNYTVTGTSFTTQDFAVSGVTKIAVAGTEAADGQAFSVLDGTAIAAPLDVTSGVETTTISGAIDANAATTGTDVSIASAAISVAKDITNRGGGVSLGGAVTLAADVAITTFFTSFLGRSIAFGGTVDGPHKLTVVNSHLTTSFASPVGGKTPLTSLTTSNNISTGYLTAGSVTTTGNQSYGELAVLGGEYTTAGGAFSTARNVTLASDTTVTTAGGTVAFSRAVDGGRNLEIKAGDGAVNFTKAVGGTTPLGSLWIRSAGSVSAASRIFLDGAVAGARNIGLAVGSGAKNVTLAVSGSTIKNFSTYGILLDSVKSSTLSGFQVTGSGVAGAMAMGDLGGT